MSVISIGSIEIGLLLIERWLINEWDIIIYSLFYKELYCTAISRIQYRPFGFQISLQFLTGSIYTQYIDNTVSDDWAVLELTD